MFLVQRLRSVRLSELNVRAQGDVVGCIVVVRERRLRLQLSHRGDLQNTQELGSAHHGRSIA